MHLPEPCPYLPHSGRPLTSDDIHALGTDRSERFYFTALDYAQVLWLEGFPAKALLLVNRALSCWLPEVSLKATVRHRPPFELPESCVAAPYHAKAWLLRHRTGDRFIGNPRRHYQHLATRMVEPHKELRSWRAWACWYLAKESLPEQDFPADAKQIREEGVVEPTYADISQHLSELSPSDDVDAWRDALAMVHCWRGKAARGDVTEFRIEPATEADLLTIQALAHEIWHAVYPDIIGLPQIEYMLERMYSLATLRREFAEGRVRHALVLRGEEPVGYLSWEADAAARTVQLHKIYLKPSLHGMGVGGRALAWVEERTREAGLAHLRLRVNRGNSPAIRAYRRAGFEFEEEVCSDIGGGFVMDDYVMGKRLG